MTVIEFTMQIQGLLAVGEGLLMVSEQGMTPAEVVERAGLPEAIAGNAGEVQGVLVVGEGLGVVALSLTDHGKGAVSAGLAVVVVEGLIEGEGLLKMNQSVGVVPELKVGVAEGVASAGLGGAVTKMVCCGEGGVLGGDPVVSMSSSAKEAGQSPGQLPGVDVKPMRGGVGDSG